ncbi:hypothetical protein KIW84_062310 [Lathyrus oleraceus]|uniref:DUF7745 domain-containing protein n=1 Tax=Pisum sativum TaxID=3888 RepID=A0A9D5A5N6_PEA|nr:hypothetical protein KIW84_062310 [Pisum sativum]
MDKQRRNTKKYSFRQPDLKELRSLISYVLDPLEFKARHGKLLSILATQVDKGLMSVLVQFYDPLYRCFTFLDFQLLPTLEEYAYLVGIPILDQLPFSGLERVPSSQEIADLLRIDESIIGAHMTTKGGIQGLPSDFLIEQATMFGKAMSEDAFEAIFVILIYGLLLFPNIDKFVDVNAIRIFSTLNLVPTLLGDTYFSLHIRNAKSGGTIIIDSCGEFSNVPLLGTCGGINYNPILARRQLGFPLKDKPNNILLETMFFQEGKDPQGLKGRMVHAWCKIHKKGRKELGPKNCIALEPYTSWVRRKASEYLMPYEYPRPTPLVVVGPSTLPSQGIREKDALIEFLEHQVIDDLDDAVTSLLPQSSKIWKRKYDRLAKEKANMEAAYEREVKRLRATYLSVSPQCSHLVWYSIIKIVDSGIHRYGTRRNQQRAMEGLQAGLAEMRIRMNQFMEVVQGVAEGQQEIRLLVQENPPTTQPEVVADPPVGEANGPNGPGPHQSHMATLEDFGMGHGMDHMFRRLEERLKVVEGQNALGVDVADLGLVPGVRVPPKFKVPVFDKYNGNSCPKTHVQAYFRKMIAYSDDEKLLLYFFQDSLAGASLEWYMRLDRAHIRCWRDLAEAFVKQYQYNADMAPDRTQL